MNRHIYTTAIGRVYDPLAVHRELILADINTHIRGMSSADPVEAAKAEAEVIRISRAAFQLEPLCTHSGTGVPDAVVLDILTDFNGWMEGKG